MKLVMRSPLRAELIGVAEDIVDHARQSTDRRMLGLAERNLRLVERQYAGLEKVLDFLNYDDLTKATLRRERETMGVPINDAGTSLVADQRKRMS